MSDDPVCRLCNHPASSHRIRGGTFLCRDCPDGECRNGKDRRAATDTECLFAGVPEEVETLRPYLADVEAFNARVVESKSATEADPAPPLRR